MIRKKLLLILLISLVFFLLPIFWVQAALPIKILLIPGHDNEVWGAQYGNTKEADMNLVLATRIFNLLKNDKRFEVYITRDSLGYTTEFADYFTLHRQDIISFEKDSKKKVKDEIDTGTFTLKKSVPHHGVSDDIALRLYGFNKWAGENKIDAMIHIHFNDYPRSNKWKVGQYKGFTIYVPDSQFSNSKKSLQLGKDIFTQLNKKYIVSTYKPEAKGLIPDQKLIAVGANGTLEASVRSVLIEYGYIYQKIFQNTVSRHQAYKTMADLTFQGIKNYFFP
jgi:N-acetylmuramoyl-L-alanine amidase